VITSLGRHLAPGVRDDHDYRFRRETAEAHQRSRTNYFAHIHLAIATRRAWSQNQESSRIGVIGSSDRSCSTFRVRIPRNCGIECGNAAHPEQNSHEMNVAQMPLLRQHKLVMQTICNTTICAAWKPRFGEFRRAEEKALRLDGRIQDSEINLN